MTHPCRDDYENVDRIGKYLNGGARRMEQLFPFGQDDGVICACSDSDWAMHARPQVDVWRGLVYREWHEKVGVVNSNGHFLVFSGSGASRRH